MIKWITDSIGTGAFEKVQESSSYVKIDVRDMVDKEGNSAQTIKQKLEVIQLELKQGNKVVVCCDYGMSRSNSIAVGAITQYLEVPFTEALKLVLEKTKEKKIKIEVLNVVYSLFHVHQENKLKKEALLVTGGTGLIGKNLLKRLSSYNVVAPSSSEINLECDTVALDIFVKEMNVKTIVHLANPRIYTTNSSMSSSILMLKNVLDVCVNNNIKIIYLTNWEVYSGYKTSELYASEVTSRYPKGTYGLAKFMCENLISACANFPRVVE